MSSKKATKKSRGRPKGDPTVTLAVRLPAALVADVDAYCEALGAAVAGVSVSRNQGFRRLILVGLEAERRARKR